MNLELETLKTAIAGNAAAFRRVTDYQPTAWARRQVVPST